MIDSSMHRASAQPATTVPAPRLDPNDDEQDGRVHVIPQTEETVSKIYRTITEQSHASSKDASPSADFEEYLRQTQRDGNLSLPLSVCFNNLTTYGTPGGSVPVKTLSKAIWRSLTFQDVYEWTFKRIISPVKIEDGHALIRDFSGVVKNGEMMLILGNPGSGCSTFLRTIGNDHKSFLGVRGSLNYSGLSSETISQRLRGLVTYVPEDDKHLPTLTVRQTLEFALQNKTPRRHLERTARFVEEFGRAFGMSHVMDTLVGNEFIRGVSGGERKRVSILESLASDASVTAWDGSTRGLDASSALDFARALRIMTDACRRATVVSLYQASDAIYELMDKVVLIDEGRMLYNGPARDAEAYFTNLGYQRLPRQTMSDFLTGITSGSSEQVRKGHELSIPRGAVNLEQAFRSSKAFKDVQDEIRLYESDLAAASAQATAGRSETSSIPTMKDIQQHAKATRSRLVPSRSSYHTSFPRQIVLCAKREYWQLRGHLTPLVFKMISLVVCALLLSSMFYNVPDDTRGVFSRGGFTFYSSAIVAWFQMSELETAFRDRVIVSRQKGFAMVRPSAVVFGKTLLDIPLLLILSVTYSIIAYFISGLRLEASSFFTFVSAIFLCAMAFTGAFRVFSALSPKIEGAFRYAGVYLQIGVACGGYVRSLDRLISDVPWVGWLGYLTPVPYTFDILMANEFHDRTFPCDQASIIPSGPSYNNSDFQSCASTSATQQGVNGDSYLQSEFGFSYSNLGLNYAILVIFMVGFLLLNMWVVENLDWVQSGGALHEVATRKGDSAHVAKPIDEESTDNFRAPGGINEKAPQQQSVDVEKPQHSGAVFTWHKLNYYISHKHGQKQLLKDVSGFCEPGKLTALVGASGAGKSTLLTVLTQQASGKLSGEMTVDGRPVGPSFGRTVGYCQQMDIHIETSTVREAFEFSALLRQSQTISRQDKLAYANKVLDTLGMLELQDVVIRSLSLEQKKRVTIGVELCAKPSLLLFLDEPTSGLDSQGAMSIVKLLRRLADDGQAIICTIHQASQEQFDIFDRVLAVEKGGQVYYFGEVANVVPYFSRHGVTVSPEKNVADLLIEVAIRRSSEHKTTTDWADVWNESPEAAAVLDRVENIMASPKTTQDTSNVSIEKSNYASTIWQQTSLLTRRTFTQYWRAPDYIYSRLYASVIHAGLNGLMFLQLDNTLAAMQYRIFSCFLVLMLVPEFINATAVMFDDNRNVFLGRERPSRVYGAAAFCTANIAAEVPYALAGAVVFYLLFYFPVGLPLGVPALYTFLMTALFHLFITSWGQWIAALSSDAGMAASIMPFFVIVCELFNGVLQPRALMPVVWQYTTYYLGPFTYWISGIVAVILPRLQVRCADSELIRFQAPANSTCGSYAEEWLQGTHGYLSNPDATSDCGYCQYASGEEYLSTLDLAGSVAWPYFGIFALFTVTNYLSVYLWVYIKSVKNWLPW